MKMIYKIIILLMGTYLFASPPDGGNGPPECLMDCPDIESLFENEDPVKACQIFASWDGDDCVDDCDEEVLGEVGAYISACSECIDSR